MSLAEKKVLVTGATGLVGANLVTALIARGAKVRATVHRKQPASPTADVEYFTADLTRDEDCVRAAAGCELIFHCAARGASAGGFNRSGGLEFLENFYMDARLLAAAQAAGAKKFLWLGSTTAYPPTGDREVAEDELLVGEPFEKYYGVGWCKRFTEVVCKIYAERATPKLSVAVLRPSSIYGPGDDFDLATAHVVPALVRKVVERWSPLEVWGTGNEERDLVFVDDVVDALLLAAEKVEGHAAYNIGAGASHTIREVIETLTRLDGFVDAKIQFDPTKPTTIPVRRISITRAAKELGWRPRVTLEEGLRRTYKYFRAQRA
ncbi:MAG: hypothetical protein RLZZ350_1035 [Verrucomicrobiota bacterium]